MRQVRKAIIEGRRSNVVTGKRLSEILFTKSFGKIFLLSSLAVAIVSFHDCRALLS